MERARPDAAPRSRIRKRQTFGREGASLRLKPARLHSCTSRITGIGRALQIMGACRLGKGLELQRQMRQGGKQGVKGGPGFQSERAERTYVEALIPHHPSPPLVDTLGSDRNTTRTHTYAYLPQHHPRHLLQAARQSHSITCVSTKGYRTYSPPTTAAEEDRPTFTKTASYHPRYRSSRVEINPN